MAKIDNILTKKKKGMNIMEYERLKYGATATMTAEEKLQHKRELQARWRHNHPDKIRAQNRYYKEWYAKIKPFECVCKQCGRKFDAPRSSYVICPDCLKERKKLAEMKRHAIILKREERQAEYQEIVEWYNKGMTQEIIAEDFGRTQSNISQIIRRLNKKGRK